MKGGYRILWTDHALAELRRTFQYLESTFSEKDVSRLANKIENTLRNISISPYLNPESAKQAGVRRAVVLTFNTLYYRVNIDQNQIEILSFFTNRQDPDSIKL